MRSPAHALAWQFWGRHRFGLSVSLAYLLTQCALALVLPADALFVWVRWVGWAPLGVMMVFLLAVFAYGADVRVEAAHSGFPARMFTLPVPTGLLVGLPMLCGTATVALAWVVWARCVCWPCGIEAPLGWPALLLAALLAWLQALTWSPAGLPWARVLFAVPVLIALPWAALEAFQREAPPGTIAAALVGCIAAAYPVAYAGVRRARRGDGRGLEWLPRVAGRVWDLLPHRRLRHASPARAQFWLEWRQSGLVAPGVVVVSLTFLLPFFSPWRAALAERAEEGVFPTLTAAVGAATPIWLALGLSLLVPLYGAFIAGGSMGYRSFEPRRLGLGPFLATRPLTSGELVLVKLRVAAWSTLASWALLLAVLSLWLTFTGCLDEAARGWMRLVGEDDPWLAAALFGIALLVLVGLTWRTMVVNLFIPLTGRMWVSHVAALVVVVLLCVFGSVGLLVYQYPELQGALLSLVPWLAWLAVVVKLLLAGRALAEVRRRRLLEEGTLAKLLAGWLLIAGGLIAVLAWLSAGAVPLSDVILGVVLLMPLARLAIAPLALAWDRHR
jgi:hypothetical protein